jgi:hypothetical protein
MRVDTANHPRDPHRDRMCDDAEWWLRHHARDRWRVREDEDCNGREVLVFEFPADETNFHYRIAPAEHRGWLN